MLGKIFTVQDKILTQLENWVLFTAVMAGLISMFFNVVLRYGFNYSLAWSEELVREVIIVTTFIGCSAAIKNRNMITINAVAQLVPRLKLPLDMVSHVATLIYSVMIGYLGWQMALQQAATNQKTIYMQIPLVFFYAILPVNGLMMFLRTLQVLYADLQARRAAKKEAA
jgi:TRAP-type C4-dicarboxylate transport system permease small subunit